MDKNAPALINSIRDAGPNVYVLVRLPRGMYVFRWVNGRLVYRAVRSCAEDVGA